eukprot:SAG11_NODE_7997_length_1072_cov_0.882837_2_plen_73_part_00
MFAEHRFVFAELSGYAKRKHSAWGGRAAAAKALITKAKAKSAPKRSTVPEHTAGANCSSLAAAVGHKTLMNR